MSPWLMKLFQTPFWAYGNSLYGKPSNPLDADFKDMRYYGEYVEDKGKQTRKGYGIYSKMDKKGKIEFISQGYYDQEGQ